MIFLWGFAQSVEIVLRIYKIYSFETRLKKVYVFSLKKTIPQWLNSVTPVQKISSILARERWLVLNKELLCFVFNGHSANMWYVVLSLNLKPL